MVELIDALILDNLAPKETVNLSFDVGLNEISYDKRYIFNFLLLRNQALDKGRFVVNGKTIVPLENPDNSLFLLAVNSQNISMSACFELTRESKKEDIKNIQQELIELRDLPLNTNNDKIAKLDKIFSILKNHHAAYVLINKGNDINKTNINLLDLVIVDHASELTIITLDDKDTVKHPKENNDELDVGVKNVSVKEELKQEVTETVEREEVIQEEPKYEEPVQEEPDFYDYVEIGGEHPGIHRQSIKKSKPKKEFKLFNFENKNKETPKKEVTKKPATKQQYSDVKVTFDLHYIKKLMKKEWSSFLFILYGTLSTIFFSFIVPYQFNKSDNSLLSTIFLIGALLCFLVTVLITSSIYSFFDKEVISKKRHVYTVVFNEIFIVLGIILAYALLRVLMKKDILVKASEYNSKFYFFGLIVAAVTIVVPFFIKYIRKAGLKIKSIFKKDN